VTLTKEKKETDCYWRSLYPKRRKLLSATLWRLQTWQSYLFPAVYRTWRLTRDHSIPILTKHHSRTHNLLKWLIYPPI